MTMCIPGIPPSLRDKPVPDRRGVRRPPVRGVSAKPSLIVDELMALYEVFGARACVDRLRRRVEHSGHMARRALSEGFDQDVVLAAFFYNIEYVAAHAVGVRELERYQDVCAGYLLERGFSGRVCRIVGSRVDAERYMRFRWPDQPPRARMEGMEGVRDLSAMSESEAGLYEGHPDFPIYVQLREWDGQKLDEGMPSGILIHIRRIASRHLHCK
ncbi:hypothetical protein [Marilutibacter maris]|uniref:hypothetical protein n=1 Tax=Marilutibacter maris TaxID=1605891 RepID=UPI0011AE7699|nr:hypothetical protein [Lysobacter maris]